MNPEDGSSLIWGVTMAVVLIGSLAARRLPLGQTLKMILAWVAIFALLFVLFSFRNEFGMIWQRVKSDIAGTANQQLVGQTLRLTRNDDGHFWVLTKINGKTANFLVDSGASVTSISTKTADDTNVDYSRNSVPVLLDTANGRAKAWRGEISSFDVGGIKLSDHNVLVGESLGETNLLGMNFLGELSSWRVEGDVMVLEP
ncbi:MAG: TIGR02281 family clan AA aspartic protease [Sphingorhabdus sp.]